MNEDPVVSFSHPDKISITDPLTEVLRTGARRLLAEAVEAEVEAFIGEHADLSDDNGRRRVVRHGGIVRLTGRELADQERSRFSRGKLTPFSERGNAVLLEDIAAVEVAVMVEMIVDRGVDGGKFL